MYKYVVFENQSIAKINSEINRLAKDGWSVVSHAHCIDPDVEIVSFVFENVNSR